MHDNNDVNDIAECSLLNDILYTSRCVTIKKYCYSPILYRYIYLGVNQSFKTSEYCCIVDLFPRL